MGWFLWALGSLAIAWATPSIPATLLSLGLAVIWFVSNGHNTVQYPLWSIAATPFAALVAYGALSCRLKSRILLSLAAAAFTLFLLMACSSGKLGLPTSFFAMTAAGMLIWALGEWAAHRPQDAWQKDCLRTVGVAVMVIAAYVASFIWTNPDRWTGPSKIILALALISTSLFLSVLLLAVKWGVAPPSGRWGLVSFLTFAGAVLETAAFVLMLWGSKQWEIPIVILAHLSLLAFAGAWIAAGFDETRRGAFWAGVFLAVAVVITRFIEYDTNLMLKAAGFIACGVIVVYAGIEYERWIKRNAAAGGGNETA
jgi:hypothetical protein